MSLRSVAATLLVLTLASQPLPAAQRITLKGGYEIRGDVLRKTDDFAAVYIGSDVLRIPQGDIVQIDEIDQSENEASSAVFEGKTDQWQLFRTASLPKTTIEQNVDQFAEAVVMITCPGGQGSGFVISPDGYVITNYHVIAQETQIRATIFHQTDTGFEQRIFRKVKIIALNPFVDLALLKIEDATEPFTYSYLGDVERVEVGQSVFAIGNPLGLTRTVSQGIVSTANRNFLGQLYIQTTTDINPGNSGGPLFNLRGEVVGVTSMGYIYLGGLNFAIPIDVVKRFVLNRDAFAYDEDNPNSGFRYLQPAPRQNHDDPPNVVEIP